MDGFCQQLFSSTASTTKNLTKQPFLGHRKIQDQQCTPNDSNLQPFLLISKSFISSVKSPSYLGSFSLLVLSMSKCSWGCSFLFPVEKTNKIFIGPF